MIEVELKARVRDRAAVEAAVAAFARPVGKVEKRDAYWHGPDWRLNRGARGFRIRSEGPAAFGAGSGATSVVTFKTKRSEGGIEINREREFQVSDPEAFIEFALRLGCEPFYDKSKSGLAFKAASPGACPEEITIEIIEVAGLGDFIEIEAILEDEDPARLALAQGEIRAILARAGLGEGDIEPRFYSELLMEAGIVARP